MKNFLHPLRHKLGSLIFGIKYRLGIAKEGKDFFTYGPDQPEHMPMPKEFRCCICYRRDICPAYDTGVLFPCPHYKEEEHGTEE